MDKERIINSHTHIFTGDQVPPYLAKSFLPWPLYYLVPLTAIVSFFRVWNKDTSGMRMKPWYKRIARTLYEIKMTLKRIYALLVITRIAQVFFTLEAFFILYDWVRKISGDSDSKLIRYIEDLRAWLMSIHLPAPVSGTLLQVAVLLIVVLFIPAGRKIIFLLLKQLWKFFGMLPGKATKEMAQRYLYIGRFAFHKEQATIFGRLADQYPEDTAFVVLPMDMEYMGAGKLKPEHRYRNQMEELAKIKEKKANILPFVFVDPRRIGRLTEEKNYQPGDKEFLSCTITENKVTLNDCFIRNYIEVNKFSGFKIYPALGYFPFDERLLPLWKYAADNKIPILTHCIKGVIFYRGKKKKDWDYHQYFTQAMGNEVYDDLLLPETRNYDYTANFTHPLNFFCLLNEELLRKMVKKAGEKNNDIKVLFGYTNDETPLKYNLSHLKVCLGHFGGEDQWKRYFESDRFGHSAQLAKHPDRGIDFLYTDRKPMPGKIEQIWKFTDWYSIICSLMLQYPNVYADVSYIIYDGEAVFPLLKETLQNPKLKNKVLYGTDFYVVRNHKSDKNILADVYGGLSPEEFDLIAVQNPKTFLNLPAQQPPDIIPV